MTYLVVLAALALVPVLAIMLLRVNGAVAFMSLCLGSVLVAYVSGDVEGVFTSFAASRSVLTADQWIQVALLGAPLLLTVLFTRGSVRGARGLTNLLPALATGLLFALLLVPLLPADVQHHLSGQTAWRQLSDLQTAVLLAGAAFSLLFLLFTRRGRGEDEGRRKHAKG